MLILSLRDNDSRFRFGKPTWHENYIRNPELDPEAVQAGLADLRVGILIHGYNVEDAMDAYARMALAIQDRYDEIVGLTWPASISAGFWWARRRAEDAGQRLRNELHFLNPYRLDLQGHSLGCRVALEALRAGLHCRNLLLAAPAVGDDEIARSARYGEAIDRAQRVLVAHSAHDRVLRRAYRLAVWDRALGLKGPRKPELVAEHVSSLDLSSSVGAHGDYKRTPGYIGAWRAMTAMEDD